LFNELTGLNQKVGNYPGITVEKKQGSCKLSKTATATITDLPGTYSIHPTTVDESIVLNTLLDAKSPSHPDVVIVVAEVENIKRNLFLFSQIKDLGIPAILVINMADQLKKKGISIDVEALSLALKTPVQLISTRKNQGISELKQTILNYKNIENAISFPQVAERIDAPFFNKLQESIKNLSLYKSWLLITQDASVKPIANGETKTLESFKKDTSLLKKYQHKETIYRYQTINDLLKKTVQVDRSKAKDLRSKLDKILTHKIFGYLIFAVILFTMFQAVFDLATIPMDYIDGVFSSLSSWTQSVLPPGTFTSLLVEGVIPGIGGIVIFIPQIAFLFLFIAILEETGYMSRVVFLMDKIMRKFGMNGKSIIPLIAGNACAIPAIMAARNIHGWKERLITILVTPFTTCAARLPVYAIIIALIIPNERIFGLGLQGLALTALYLLGFGAALSSAYLLHKILKIKSQQFFVIEMPNYKLPSFKNVAFTVIEKSKEFVWGAGKIILAISVVLWFLASNGSDNFKNAAQIVSQQASNQNIETTALTQKVNTFKLEHSYLGMVGKTIEPAIEPLGYDWKIGIALLSSFAAREVFVGTLATIYSVGDGENTGSIKQRMKAEVNPITGEKRFTFPAGMSLLVFYAFAMQCMGTLAIVKRETNSWKWPLLQLFGMSALAYVAALLTFVVLT